MPEEASPIGPDRIREITFVPDVENFPLYHKFKERMEGIKKEYEILEYNEEAFKKLTQHRSDLMFKDPDDLQKLFSDKDFEDILHRSALWHLMIMSSMSESMNIREDDLTKEGVLTSLFEKHLSAMEAIIKEAKEKDPIIYAYHALYHRRNEVIGTPERKILLGLEYKGDRISDLLDRASDLLYDITQLALDAKVKYGQDFCKTVVTYHVASGSTLKDDDFETLKSVDFEGESAIAEKMNELLDEIDKIMVGVETEIEKTEVPLTVVEEDYPMELHPSESDIRTEEMPEWLKKERTR